VENFYCKVVGDLETELANLDPTVPMRSVLGGNDEQEGDPTAEDDKTPWVMRGMWARHGIHNRDELFFPPSTAASAVVSKYYEYASETVATCVVMARRSTGQVAFIP